MALVGIFVVAFGLSFVPVATAATPAIDCGGTVGSVTGCVNLTGGLSCTRGGCTPAVTLAQTLTTNNPVLVVIVVTADSVSDTVSSGPTVGGNAVTGTLCSSSTNTLLTVYYYYSGTALSSSSVSVTVTGAKNDIGGLMAFGVSGTATSSPFFDAVSPDNGCITNSGNSATASATKTVSHGNDFIVGAASATGSVSLTSGDTAIVSTAGSGGSKFGMASGYITGSTGISSYSPSFTISASSPWDMAAIAILDSSPQSIPFLPQGVLPILVVVPVLYLYLKRSALGRQGTGGVRKW